MVARLLMGVRKVLAAALLVLAAGSRVLSLAQATPPPAPATPGAQQDSHSQPTDSSVQNGSSQTVHRKIGPNSSQTIRHTRIAEESSQSPELARAEESIQKQDYAAAEPLLRKVVERDPGNYVAWFDLGFVENGLGKVDDSIAAYRKSVTAKPDVFESNLNLGLQLAKSGQPDAEKFLHAATQLKPTSHVAEGKARAWLSLAH